MSFSDALYDRATQAVLAQALEAAWQAAEATNSSLSQADLIMARHMMTLRLILAANEGERDLERLKKLAVRAADAP